MAESCSTFPTLTRTRGIKTQSVVTTTSTIISTIPASTFNITTTIPCDNTSCPSTVILTEAPAHPVTTQVPVTLTTQIDTFSVATLFGSSCALPNSRPNQVTPISTPSTPISSTTSSRSSSISRPSLIQTTSVAISTRPDGIVTSSIIIMTVPPPEQTSESAANSGGVSHSNLGPIVGGAVGGAVLLGIVALAVWYFLKKQTARRGLDDFDMFEKDDPPLNTKSHHHYSDHNSSGVGDSFGQQQAQHTQQYQPQARYNGAFDSQAQHYPYSEQMQGYQPDSQHFQHHYDSQQSYQAQQSMSPNQTQGLDPSSSQQQYGDPRIAQQQQFSPHDWQGQDPGYQGSNAVGAEAPLHGPHGARDPFIPVPIVVGYQRDSGGYPQGPGASPHHYQSPTAQYPSFQASNTYNSGPVTQSAPAPVQQRSFHPGSYMPSGHGHGPGFAPEAPGAYDRYTSDPGRQGGIAF